MKSKNLGKSTLTAEVIQPSSNGVWMLLQGKEYFLPYKAFPWFKNVKASYVQNACFVSKNHIYWPKLDVDLDLESLKDPKRYPLVYRQIK